MSSDILKGLIVVFCLLLVNLLIRDALKLAENER